MKFLVTGAAGFIGFHTAMRLLDRGDTVVGVDNINNYYDPSLKEARLANLQGRKGFTFHRLDIADRGAMAELFKSERPEKVIHLAAQAGVRYGSINANAYIDSNIVGTQNILEGCRHTSVQHLVLASSSSVYGANTAMPFSVHDNVDHPLSLYAATKKANELAGHTYAHLYGLPVTGLRFFTVYGPWGRPDMALFLFTQKILAGEPIEVFNNGHHARDFTYIDDVVDGVLRTADKTAEPNPRWNGVAAGPGHIARSLPALQHRQQQSGRAPGFHRGDRDSTRPRGEEGLSASAARRRAEDLRGHRRSRSRHRLQAVDLAGRRHRAFRCLVSFLLPVTERPSCAARLGPGRRRRVGRIVRPNVLRILAAHVGSNSGP